MNQSLPVLVVDDIHKKFENFEVLKGVSLTANKGDVVSILGSSGSGKSTFLRCINFLETPDQGTVTVAGQRVSCDENATGAPVLPPRKEIDALRTRLGMVFQGFNLWSHMTVLQNVIEGPTQVLKRPKAEAIAEAMIYLEKVGVADKADNYPSQLSGGQQQRVAIARALAMKPQVLLFDEPTSALDPELVNEVLQVMKKLAEEGCTMLVVTHEMRFAREVSNKIVFLHEGRIEDQGTPDEIFENSSSARVREFLSSHT